MMEGNVTRSASSAHPAKIFLDRPGSVCARLVRGEITFIRALFPDPSQPFRLSVCVDLATRATQPVALAKGQGIVIL
jgi:hypothetical protein